MREAGLPYSRIASSLARLYATVHASHPTTFGDVSFVSFSISLPAALTVPDHSFAASPTLPRTSNSGVSLVASTRSENQSEMDLIFDDDCSTDCSSLGARPRMLAIFDDINTTA